MTATKGGLMYEASVGGQKFSFEQEVEERVPGVLRGATAAEG